MVLACCWLYVNLSSRFTEAGWLTNGQAVPTIDLCAHAHTHTLTPHSPYARAHMLGLAGRRVGARLPTVRRLGLVSTAPARRCANGAGKQSETTTMRDYSGRKYNVSNDYVRGGAAKQ